MICVIDDLTHWPTYVTGTWGRETFHMHFMYVFVSYEVKDQATV